MPQPSMYHFSCGKMVLNALNASVAMVPHPLPGSRYVILTLPNILCRYHSRVLTANLTARTSALLLPCNLHFPSCLQIIQSCGTVSTVPLRCPSPHSLTSPTHFRHEFGEAF
jgi:hypothetical protein